MKAFSMIKLFAAEQKEKNQLRAKIKYLELKTALTSICDVVRAKRKRTLKQAFGLLQRHSSQEQIFARVKERYTAQL